MKKDKVWLITGASRGMGLAITKSVLNAGDKVIATGRNVKAVNNAIGDVSDNLLVVKMDITNPEEIKTAIKNATDKFGTIDVLVNNAGNFFAGFFEELTKEQVESQIATNLYGPMNVTREILPLMRKNRSGYIITISSTAGFAGNEFCSAYSASKFGLEGWMESLQMEIAPFGIKTTIVEPGFFRTDLLKPTSTVWAESSIADYAARNAELRPTWNAMNGKQGGDPYKLAKALIEFSNATEPPKRFLAGADAVEGAEQKVRDFQRQIDAYRQVSSSLAIE